MKIVSAMVGSLLLAAVPLAAQADEMSYRYIQLGYVETEVDIPGANESLDGFGTRGSIGFLKNYFVFTELNSVEWSDSGADIELQQVNIGLGTHWPINDTLDFVARAGFSQVDLETSIGDADEDGYVVGAGIRGQAGDAVEYEFGAVHQDLGDSSETGFEVAFRYHFNKRWAAAIEYQDIDVFSSIFAGVRVSF